MSKNLEVIITSCNIEKISGMASWYRDKIGEVFKVHYLTVPTHKGVLAVQVLGKPPAYRIYINDCKPVYRRGIRSIRYL